MSDFSVIHDDDSSIKYQELLKIMLDELEIFRALIDNYPEVKALYEQEVLVRKLKGKSIGH